MRSVELSGKASLRKAHEGVRQLGCREIGMMQARNGSQLDHVQTYDFAACQTAWRRARKGRREKACLWRA